MLLFWAPQKRLDMVIITLLSRFLLFLRAYYVQKGAARGSTKLSITGHLLLF